MSSIIPLPFKCFPVPRNAYEEFWNSEHGPLFEMFSTTPLNARNQIVHDRWKLTQRVAIHLVNNRCTTAQFLTVSKQKLWMPPPPPKAVSPRAVKHLVPVDHLSRDCPLVRPKRARVRSLPAPMCDVHWSTQCDILLQQIVEKQATFSSYSPEETHSQETPKTPARSKRTTITDFFMLASQSSSTHSSSVPHTPTSAPSPRISIKNFFTPISCSVMVTIVPLWAIISSVVSPLLPASQGGHRFFVPLPPRGGYGPEKISHPYV